MRRQPFDEIGRRRDRIAADEAHATAQRAQGDRLVTADQPVPVPARRPHAQVERKPGRCGEAGDGADAVGVHHVLVTTGKDLGDRDLEIAGRQADEAADGAHGEHVHPLCAAPMLDALAHGECDRARLRSGDIRRRDARLRIGNDDARLVERNLGGKLIELLPVERDEHVVAVGRRLHRLGGNLHQSRRLAASHLRTEQLRHQAVIAGVRAGAQEDGPCSHCAGAARSREHHGKGLTCHFTRSVRRSRASASRWRRAP